MGFFLFLSCMYYISMCCICLYCRYVELIFMIESCDVLWDDVDVCGRASLSCTDRKLYVFGLCDCGLRAGEVDIFTVWFLDITFSEGLTALLAWCVFFCLVFFPFFALPLILRQWRRLNRPHMSSNGRFNLIRPQISFWSCVRVEYAVISDPAFLDFLKI